MDVVVGPAVVVVGAPVVDVVDGAVVVLVTGGSVVVEVVVVVTQPTSLQISPGAQASLHSWQSVSVPRVVQPPSQQSWPEEQISLQVRQLAVVPSDTQEPPQQVVPGVPEHGSLRLQVLSLQTPVWQVSGLSGHWSLVQHWPGCRQTSPQHC